MFNTTYTNPDGTFSPAIQIDDRLWACSRFASKSEDSMAKQADYNLTLIKRAIVRMLVEGGYKEVTRV